MFKCRVETDPRMGRCLVADANIKKGEIVVEEIPFARGPKQNSSIVCLGCYSFLQLDESNELSDRCEKCDWPLCASCVNANDHETNECMIFSNAKVKFAANVGEDGVCLQLDCITPLRVLLAKEAYPERWQNEIQPMEDHETERCQQTEQWNADCINVAQYLRGPCKLADRFSEKLIMSVIGILDINAFEARTLSGYPLRCLYPMTGILAHNCVPNVMRSIYPSEGFKIRLRAAYELPAGTQLHHSYTYTLDGTFARQQHLKAGKYFICECKRCKDPTELDTNFSTFKCSKCEDGWILSTNPLELNAVWKCTLCGFKTSNNAIQKAVTLMQSEQTAIQDIESGSERLEETERLARKYRSILHPLHFIHTNIRQQLIEMYGRVQGYEMVALPDVLLERKQDLCRQVLRVLNIFEPGLSRSRALTLYELHVPLVLLAKSAFLAGTVTSNQLKEKLTDAVEVLRECVEILKYEDSSSQEGILGNVANDALEQLEQSVIELNNK